MIVRKIETAATIYHLPSHDGNRMPQKAPMPAKCIKRRCSILPRNGQVPNKRVKCPSVQDLHRRLKVLNLLLQPPPALPCPARFTRHNKQPLRVQAETPLLRKQPKGTPRAGKQLIVDRLAEDIVDKLFVGYLVVGLEGVVDGLCGVFCVALARDRVRNITQIDNKLAKVLIRLMTSSLRPQRFCDPRAITPLLDIVEVVVQRIRLLLPLDVD